MPECQFPVFCCFCVLEKLHRKYSRNWTKQKLNIQKFTEAFKEPKRRRSGATRGPHNRAARPRARPPPYVCGHLALVEKSLLVAHHFGICVAHMECATNATPLITVYWWRISVCATHNLPMRGAYCYMRH
jgi:hypothetical protein